ncbi:MAG TPA: hypothetical protein VKY29_02480, partial [Cryomorphaceae bacterium]|nr:hypothetical protein [Cryomorphaceae bacterium]
TAVADFGNGRCTVHKLPMTPGHLLVFFEAAIHSIRRFDNHREVIGPIFRSGHFLGNAIRTNEFGSPVLNRNLAVSEIFIVRHGIEILSNSV